MTNPQVFISAETARKLQRVVARLAQIEANELIAELQRAIDRATEAKEQE